MSPTSTTMERAAKLVGLCLLAVVLSTISACTSSSHIAFLQVPSASSGGVGTTSLIRGQITGPHRGQHVILYARADGRWWVQPFASSPFTSIADDGSWQAEIHLGSEYAALLTADEKLPPPLLDRLPDLGKGVDAIATVTAHDASPPSAGPPHPDTILRFSGYDWQVRTIPGDYAAKTNQYASSNVSVDDTGALHLRLIRQGDKWICSEIHSLRSLGYGEYRVEVRDLGSLEPAAMFSAFTRAETTSDGDHREMDVHITRRGEPANKNAEYIVQPYFVPANFYHFDLPHGPVTLRLQWQPDRAKFSALRATTRDDLPTASWEFTTGVPTSDDGQLYINFCNYGYARIPPQHDAEVVVNRFEFYP